MRVHEAARQRAEFDYTSKYNKKIGDRLASVPYRTTN